MTYVESLRADHTKHKTVPNDFNLVEAKGANVYHYGWPVPSTDAAANEAHNSSKARLEGEVVYRSDLPPDSGGRVVRVVE